MSYSSKVYPIVLLGTDAEFFFNDENGNLVPSERHLPGKKNKLAPCDDEDFDGYYEVMECSDYQDRLLTLHLDGIQGELTSAPSFCRARLLDRVREGLRVAWNRAQGVGHDIHVNSTVDTPEDFLMSCEHPESVPFGCDPDFLAWNEGNINISDVDPLLHPERYAGVHIHVGINKSYLKEIPSYYAEKRRYDSAQKLNDILQTREGKITAVQLMDMFVGNTLAILESHDPTTRARRAVFGKAGCFRPTPYGFEYRTPSALLLRHPRIFHYALGLTRGAMAFLLEHGIEGSQEKINTILEGDPIPLLIAIDQTDREAAVRNFHKIFPHMEKGSQKEVLRLLSFESRGNIFDALGDLADAWNLYEDDISKHGDLMEEYLPHESSAFGISDVR